MIERSDYMTKLDENRDKPFVKVLTGMRRVGKSTLLDLYIERLVRSGVEPDRILKINFELPEHFDIVDYRDLSRVVLVWAEGRRTPLYLFLDEVGRVEGWEKAVNGFHAMGRFDLYVTGSNADLLSSDLSTYLAGRYVEILVHPFSYAEFRLLHRDATFRDYVTYGGIPSIGAFGFSYEAAMGALRDSYRSAILQDIVSRHQIRNAVVLDKLLGYVYANIGKTFSALSISKFLKSQRLAVTVDTILHYLEIAQAAYLIHRVPRGDLIGKAMLKTEEKYYVSDHGTREALVGNNGAAIESVLENIVYIELLRRGYRVYVGKVGDREIDFVAERNGKTTYYQVAYLMESEATREREFSAFDAIDDHYPKVVVSMDRVDMSRRGVVHRNVEDFLLDE
ncbi:MAG: ATP-binding protein [Candidatus Izemoplasmatales bacterium]